jgi:16S rRNA (cytidine1402-2'-O)-methyltransferase
VGASAERPDGVIVAGTLWLVGTPIGNLGDLTERARERLAAAHVIACEDTRRTRALLTHLGIEGRRLLSFHDANERRRIPELLDHLRGGRDVAVVSDAGMPGLSDPGYRLVSACIAEGIAVDVAPGPSAPIAALVISGLPADRFVFEGFLPRRAGQRRSRLAALVRETRTIVAFESPRRLAATLGEAREVLGDRRAAVVRELTKVHQEVRRGRLSELAEAFAGEVLGEVVVVIEGAGPREPDLAALAARVEELMSGGVSRKEASARVAAESGASTRAVYQASLDRRD